jgi:hypothetical protein
VHRESTQNGNGEKSNTKDQYEMQKFIHEIRLATTNL